MNDVAVNTINNLEQHLCGHLWKYFIMSKIFYVFIFSLLITAACTPAKMAVSDELKASKDEYVVKGMNGTRIKQKLSFGEYATTSIKRSWIRGNSSRSGIGFGTPAQQDWVNLISTEYINKKQTIRFTLSDNANTSDVYCVSRFNARNLEVGKNPNSILNIGMDILGVGGKSTSNYYVQIFASDKDARPWEMVIDNQLSQSRPKEYIGYLARNSAEYYSIVPVTRIETRNRTGNILGGSIGFEFRDPKGKPVAAVSQMDKGMVFLAKISSGERFLLANACAALLLQDMIQ